MITTKEACKVLGILDASAHAGLSTLGIARNTKTE